ncbi:hypothetical protein BJ508DRAFT_373369 [Ascobolus immersus RN42]|uniref:Uncharacterized protein n=1 Tax=Ascobolus immersus RN42 TaxID=1160509 RepID=A0A3N4INQ9_ASCIM|nr:hypothetical protein BJ508DRAFT_373369 [Ascobolus immersus RN42]
MPFFRRVRQAPNALFAQFPSSGRVPFRQVFEATWMSLIALCIGNILVLGVMVTTDGKPAKGNIWDENAPTFIAVGAVFLRGGVAAMLGTTLYQKLWKGLSTTKKAKPNFNNGKEEVVAEGEAGYTIVQVDSLHLASRLKARMFVHPLMKPGWIIGALGLLITSVIQPVLQSAVGFRQTAHFNRVDGTIFHPQFNSSATSHSDAANLHISGPTMTTKNAALQAMVGQNSLFQFTTSNRTGATAFGPVKFVDVECEIEAVPGELSNSAGWDVYNFTYQFPAQESFANISWSEPHLVTTGTPRHGRAAIKATLFNNTHYLNHVCLLQTAIGNCTTRLLSGSSRLQDLRCTRESFIDVDADLQKEEFSFREPNSGSLGLIISFLEIFVGQSLLSMQGRVNPGHAPFATAAITSGLDNKKPQMPSDLLSHMQRVLWNTPLLLDYTKNEPELMNELRVPVVILDENPTVVYHFDRITIYAALGLLVFIAFSCISYLTLSRCRALGRLTRDSIVHSLTVAGPNGPAIKGACMAGLKDILLKAGDERLHFGVLVAGTQTTSGHLGFAERVVLPGSHEGVHVGVKGMPEKGMWYGGVGEVRKRIGGTKKREDQ